MDHINGQDHFNRSMRSAKVVVYDFTATWCGPCRMLAPILEGMSAEYPSDKVKFYKIDVDDNRDLAMKFQISAVPAVGFCKDGRLEPSLLVGVRSKAEYKQRIDALLA